MVQIAKNMPHLLMDGKWFPCMPAGEFGFLGERILCDLGKTGEQPSKKLLVRPLKCLQAGSSSDKSTSALEVDKIPDGTGLRLRPVVAKTYDYATPSPDGKLKREERQFLQQDVSGLLTLREAILKVVSERSPRKVWFLFYSTCKALNNFGKAFGTQQLVPLQCPKGPFPLWGHAASA